MAIKPNPNVKPTAAALRDIRKRYGSGPVGYDVIRESPLVDKYSPAILSAASKLTGSKAHGTPRNTSAKKRR